jgi:hypothetical protein
MPLAYPLLATPPQMAFLASHHIHLKYASSFYDITPMDWYNSGSFSFPGGWSSRSEGTYRDPPGSQATAVLIE